MTLTVEKIVTMKIPDAKSKIIKMLKYKDDAVVSVKVFDFEDGEYKSHVVEIFVHIDGEYEDSFNIEEYLCEDRELSLKEAKKRAKAVLRMVCQWFQYDDVEVSNRIEVYSA